MSSEADAMLGAALQNLTVGWQEARAHWRDEKAIAFEERYLKELPSRVTQASTIISELEKILKKARIDCG